MYQVGEQVIYGIHGVCTVAEVETRTVDRRQVDYLVLVPLEQNGSRYLVPTGNASAMAKLRPVLTAGELDALLTSEEVHRDSWIADENQRKQYYRKLIGSADRVALLRMVRTLHAHKQAQAAQGRKFHLCDENFLRDAQRLLSSEFSLVLGIAPAEVEAYVLSRMNA